MGICAVCIIVYSDEPSLYEKKSFIQCLEILKSHDIFIVCPRSLDVSVYENICVGKYCNIVFERFDDYNFFSIKSYNRFMRRPEFYKRFLGYKYILIYQLDAWVFRDELLLWCAKGYDYIGAPFFNDRKECLPYAGNGGFSLRKTQVFYEITRGKFVPDGYNYQFLFIKHPAKTCFRSYIKKIIHIFEMSICLISPYLYIRFYMYNEDIAYTKMLSFFRRTNIAPPVESILFSFEKFPKECYDITGNIPFGCHAFMKYDVKFWKKFIKI